MNEPMQRIDKPSAETPMEQMSDARRPKQIYLSKGNLIGQTQPMQFDPATDKKGVRSADGD